MKKQELIDKINNGHYCSLWEAEDNIPKEINKVAEGLELDEHRWYSTAVDVYKCEGGFVGVWGAYQSFSEMQSWEDLDVICEACEYEEYTTVSYKPKTS
jgi:hypothetical protein